MMNDIGIEKKQQLYIIKKMINIAIRATYYIFCCRNRNWDSPDLMQFWFFFFGFCFVLFLFLFFVFLFFVFFLFNNAISSSICKLPIRSEIYNCTFKNTIKFPLLILLLLLQEDSKQTTETASFLASHYNPSLRLSLTHAPLPTPAPREKNPHTHVSSAGCSSTVKRSQTSYATVNIGG